MIWLIEKLEALWSNIEYYWQRMGWGSKLCLFLAYSFLLYEL